MSKDQFRQAFRRYIQVGYSFVGAENTSIFGGMMDLNWAVLKFDFVFGLKFLHVQGPI
jgi:hypothetical protein